MKKNIRSLNYKFLQNIVLLSSLGICSACSNENAHCYHFDKLKNNSHDYEENVSSVSKLIKDKSLKQQEIFKNKKLNYFLNKKFLQVDKLDNLYIAPTSKLVFEIMPNNEIRVVCINVESESNKKISIPKKIEFDSQVYTVTSIGNMAFANFCNLKDVVLPNSITKIGVGAFFGCTKLESISLPNSLEIIDAFAFQGTGIKKITIPKSVQKLGDSAFDTISIEEIILEEGSQLKPGDIEKAYGGQLKRIQSMISIDSDITPFNLNTKNIETYCPICLGKFNAGDSYQKILYGPNYAHIQCYDLLMSGYLK